MSATAISTKERILDAAQDIMLKKSFHSVGLNEILAAVQVPKGSFYHYFPSKEQFGVELLRHYVSEASAYKRRMLLGAEVEPDPLLRLTAYLDCGIARMFENEGRCCCLVVKLASEVSTFSDGMREVLAEGMREWRGFLEAVVREGQARGVMRADLDPAVCAVLIQDVWMGATNRAQIERSVAPLRAAAAFIHHYVAAA